MTHMPHIYEFSIDGQPVARMNFPSLLREKDLVGIRLMLANKHKEDIDCVTHAYEFCNIAEHSVEPSEVLVDAQGVEHT